MGKHEIAGVPRYYESYVHDCFNNTYAAVIQHVGLKPEIILADYLSIMFDEESELLGTNFMFRYSTSVEFTEEELNTSFAFAYLPPTSVYEPELVDLRAKQAGDRLLISMYMHDDPAAAEERMRELLHADRPVIVIVDLFYMHFHRAYQREHGLHAVVVTGYDDEKQTYRIFDKYLLSSSDFDGEVPMEEFRAGRASLCPRTNPIAGQYNRPIRNMWMEISAPDGFREDDPQRLRYVLEESCARMTGRREVLGQVCGLERLEQFRLHLQGKKQVTEFDERLLYFWRDYYNTIFKRIARGRRRFHIFIQQIPELLGGNAELIGNGLEESAKHWDIAANLFLKLAITKRLTLLDDIDRQLQSVIALEREAVERIDAAVGARI